MLAEWSISSLDEQEERQTVQDTKGMNITLTGIPGLWEKLCAETEKQVLCKYQVEDAMPSEVVGRCVGKLR